MPEDANEDNESILEVPLCKSESIINNLKRSMMNACRPTILQTSEGLIDQFNNQYANEESAIPEVFIDEPS